MKKLLVCAAVAGVTVGFCFLLCKVKKEENVSSKPKKEKNDSEPEIKGKTTVEEQDTVQEMYAAKDKSAQSVCERHEEAAGIMADAFANIMKDIEPVELVEEPDGTIDDMKEAEVIKELDSISDELDELLK